MYSSELIDWNFIEETCNIPYGTKIKYKMTGELFSGVDNDSYIDQAFLKISTNNCSYYIEDNTSIYENNLVNLSIAPNPFFNQSIVNIPYNKSDHPKNIYLQ